LQRLVEGTLVLGQVSQINPQDIAIALPNNLVGYVSMTRISPHLTKAIERIVERDEDDETDEDQQLPSLDQLFSVGQWIRTIVVENTTTKSRDKSTKKHIELSLEPKLVNASLNLDDIVPKSLLQVSVTSIEDHGIIVSFGLGELTGFIKKSALGPYKIDDIHEGQVFLASILHRAKNNVVQLSLDLKSTKTQIGDVTDIASLLPGDTVQCLISEVRAVGAGGKIMGMLDATIDKTHIGSTSIAENKLLTARITAAFPAAEPRRVTLSVLPHVLDLEVAKTATGQSPLDALPVGFIVESTKVTEVVEDQGLYVDVGVEGVRGFVHVGPSPDGSLITDIATFRSAGGLPSPEFGAIQGVLGSPRTDYRLQSCRQPLLALIRTACPRATIPTTRRRHNRINSRRHNREDSG